MSCQWAAKGTCGCSYCWPGISKAPLRDDLSGFTASIHQHQWKSQGSWPGCSSGSLKRPTPPKNSLQKPPERQQHQWLENAWQQSQFSDFPVDTHSWVIAIYRWGPELACHCLVTWIMTEGLSCLLWDSLNGQQLDLWASLKGRNDEA